VDKENVTLQTLSLLWTRKCLNSNDADFYKLIQLIGLLQL